MKLYFSPFACSVAAHIVCREGDLDVALQRTDFRDKRVEGGGDLRGVNPMGQVPTLVLDDGSVLTENSAVLSYLGDRRPERGLAPDPRSPARYELQRWLSFVGTELHKKVLALVFDPSSPDAVKEYGRAAAPRALTVVDQHLTDRETLLGSEFTVADAYLYWALWLLPHTGVSLDAFPAVRAYRTRIGERPAVRAAMTFERTEFERPFEQALS
ncbi:MAG: glutathione binding-like protein [Polyangiaceae bacterium]